MYVSSIQPTSPTQNTQTTQKPSPLAAASKAIEEDKKKTGLTFDHLMIGSTGLVGATLLATKGWQPVAKISAGLLVGDTLTRKLYPGKTDKRKHSLFGGVIAGGVGELTASLSGNRVMGAIVGAASGTVAGGVKELLDIMGFGEPDGHDFWATTLGSITVGTSLLL